MNAQKFHDMAGDCVAVFLSSLGKGERIKVMGFV
jgi:hypothetical protein